MSFELKIDRLRMPEAVAACRRMIEQHDRCRYIVTPNAQHLRLLEHDTAFQAAYRDAALVLADGWPVRLIFGAPERVAGSDLVPALFDSGARLRVYLLGALRNNRRRAMAAIAERWRNVTVVGGRSPLHDFEQDYDQCREICKEIAEAQPDVVLVALGAPRQEIWCRRWAPKIEAPLLLPTGSVIDLLAGKGRAPAWTQAIGCEWLYRLCREPGRMAPRYAADAWFLLTRGPMLATHRLVGSARSA